MTQTQDEQNVQNSTAPVQDSTPATEVSAPQPATPEVEKPVPVAEPVTPVVAQPVTAEQPTAPTAQDKSLINDVK